MVGCTSRLRGDVATSACVFVVAALFLSCSLPEKILVRTPPVEIGGDVTRYRLANGLTAILVEDHWHPMVALEVCYRVGARSDPYGKQGLSHLLEHLTFASPSGTRGTGREATTFAAKAHATTERDSTCYGYTLPQQQLNDALSLEAKRMSVFEASDADLEREKTVVDREHGELVEGDTWRSLLLETDLAAFRLHPYRFPVQGWTETRAQIELSDLRRHFDAFYSPSNATVVVVGDFQRDEVLHALDRLYRPLPQREGAWEAVPIEPTTSGERRVIVSPRGRPRIVFAYRVPALSSGDGTVLRVLAALLVGVDDAIMADALYGEAAAEDLGIEYERPSRDADLFYLKVVPPHRNPDFARIIWLVDDVFEDINEHGPGPDSLEQAKKHLLVDRYVDQSISSRATTLARRETLGSDALTDRFIDEVRAVGVADVQRVVRRYFSPENRIVGISGSDHDSRREGAK